MTMYQPTGGTAMRVLYQARQISMIWLFVVISIVFPSFPTISAETKDEDLTKPPGLWKRWTQYMDPTLQRVIELDLWGISTPQLPKGIWKIKYSYEHQLATKKFDDSGNKVPIAPTLQFPGLKEGQTIFTMDLQGKSGGGEGVGHTIQMSYGMTDRLNWYIEFPFQDAEVSFDTVYTPGNLSETEWTNYNNAFFGTDPILGPILNPIYRTVLGSDLRREEDFWKWVELMGRPKLKTHYKSGGWDLGDIHFGLSWNYFKGKYLAAATTGRLYVPTGYQPDANNNIELFTGAGFPAGTRTFGLSTTQGVDFRLPDPLKWVVFNAECTYEYRFESRRHSPTFPKREGYYNDVLFPVLKELEPDIAAVFPDLSEMGDSYYITYGHSFDGEIGLTLNPLQILPIGFKYAGGWSQKPDIESQSQDFIDYVEGVEIVGEQVKHVLAVGTGISLIPFYIPLNIIFEYRIPIGGSGAFVVDENYKITTELFLIF